LGCPVDLIVFQVFKLAPPAPDCFKNFEKLSKKSNFEFNQRIQSAEPINGKVP
jgi:hypothetical protein